MDSPSNITGNTERFPKVTTTERTNEITDENRNYLVSHPRELSFCDKNLKTFITHIFQREDVDKIPLSAIFLDATLETSVAIAWG